jgi:starvation-inducible DNA-binding protein
LYWSVAGPLFRPLHLYLDEPIDSWRELADTVAERALAIGLWPDGQAEAIVAGGERVNVAPGAVEDRAVVRELVGRVVDVAERVRARMDRLGELDLASRDVVIEVARALQEQLWMVRAQLSQEPGA